MYSVLRVHSLWDMTNGKWIQAHTERLPGCGRPGPGWEIGIGATPDVQIDMMRSHNETITYSICFQRWSARARARVHGFAIINQQ